MGHQQVLDHMFFDGLQNPSDGNMMGHFAEETAKKYAFSREIRTRSRLSQYNGARAAMANGAFDAETTAVTISGRKGDTTISEDDGPGNADIEKIPTMRPAFAKDGTVTAASSSSISDGAAALAFNELERRQKPWAQAAGNHQQALRLRPRTGMVYHRTGIRDQGLAQKTRLEPGHSRSIRNQRGLRLRYDGGHDRPWPGSRQS